MIPEKINNETEYDAALEQLDRLMDASAGSAEGEQLSLLADLIELYEDEVHPIDVE